MSQESKNVARLEKCYKTRKFLQDSKNVARLKNSCKTRKLLQKFEKLKNSKIKTKFATIKTEMLQKLKNLIRVEKC